MQGAETPDIDEQNQVENFVVAVFLFLDFPNTFLQVLMMLLKVSCEVRKTKKQQMYMTLMMKVVTVIIMMIVIIIMSSMRTIVLP